VKPKTLELLGFMLWTAEELFQPLVRNLAGSYEEWAYGSGFWRQVATLQRERCLERKGEANGARSFQLTERGRLLALGGRDPAIEWARAWDGRWRMVLFDVPAGQNARRERIRRYLRHRVYGCLQQSVWITPHPLTQERAILAGDKVEVSSLICFEAQTCAGETNAEVIACAWDYERINQCYARHLALLERRPCGQLADEGAARGLHLWAREERAAWFAAVSIDPLLPKALAPPGYRGPQAWQRRREVLAAAGEQIQRFAGFAAGRERDGRPEATRQL